MSFIEMKFTGLSAAHSEILIALLADAGFAGFEEEQNVLRAFIAEDQFNKSSVNEAIEPLSVSYTVEAIPETNWNNVWESNFAPVIIEEFCVVRAHFHDSFPNVAYDIVITPKMSFGTGHHATTYMMIRQMEEMQFQHKAVLDFGTGTGVLAILARKMGADKVVAIDNDDWSIANARENIVQNDTEDIVLMQADRADQNDRFDIILANITRNVILDNFYLFVDRLSEQGILLLSGLLLEDEQSIQELAVRYKLSARKKMIRDNWICLQFGK